MTSTPLVYVGFTRRIAALDQRTGEVVWSWKASSGRGFVSLLPEGDKLFASVQGYTYCLHAATGEELWKNRLTGFGMGIACLATSTGNRSPTSAAAAQLYAQQAQASAGNSSAAGH